LLRGRLKLHGMTGVASSRETRVRGFLASEKAERTRLIVEAAYELIDAGGFDELTIRSVLKRTGLARRAFYEQFAGKDDLVLAVFEQALRFAAQMYNEMVEPIADPLERLKTIILSISSGSAFPEDAGNGEGNRMAAALSREHLRLADARPAELQVALAPLMALIARQLAEAMAAGTVRQADPARLALFIYNLIATTVHTELIAGEARPPRAEQRQQLADELWEFCYRAIAA
jgi:AcrR family transcriptional regulator